jgi:hypothetical protein
VGEPSEGSGQTTLVNKDLVFYLPSVSLDAPVLSPNRGLVASI